MRYVYNEAGQLTNGVIFYFEAGDVEIALVLFEIVNVSDESPTSIVWDSECLTVDEVLRRLKSPNALDQGLLGIRFTLSESKLLKSCLSQLALSFPGLSTLTQKIKDEVFGKSARQH